MLKTYKVLGSMVALKEFTAESLHKHSGVNLMTIRSVIGRKEQILDRLGFVENTGSGGRFIRYRLKPEAEKALRAEIGDLFDSVKELPNAGDMPEAAPKSPLGLFAAQNALIRLYPQTDQEGKRELLEMVDHDIDSARLELKALVKNDPERAKAAEALMRSVRLLKLLSEAELTAESDDNSQALAVFPIVYDELLKVKNALFSQGEGNLAQAISERVLESPLLKSFVHSLQHAKLPAGVLQSNTNVLAVGRTRPTFSGNLEGNHRTIALMPLTGNRPSHAYLYDGITRGIWSKVSELRDLTVVSPTRTPMQESNQALNPKAMQELGRQLNVDAVLVGNVAVNRNRLRCNTKLFDVANGLAIWQQDYDTELSNVFSLEEDISRSVSENLQISLTDEEKAHLGERPTDSSDAYKLYMEGRYNWSQWTADGTRKAIDNFKQALKKDSRYALAYAGLADCYNMCTYELAIAPGECFPEAKAKAYEALEIDEHLAEAHTALAYSRLRYYWSWNEAEDRYLKAIDLNPNYTLARLWYAEYLAALSRFDEAFAQVNEAQQLDPESFIIRVTKGSIYYFAGEYDLAIEQFRDTLKRSKNYIRAHFRLGGVYIEKGMHEDAIRELKTAVKLSHRNPREESSLAYAYAASGQQEEARRMLDRLKKSVSPAQYVSSYNVALVHIALGEIDAAFDRLEKACNDRDPWLVFVKVDPRMSGIRSDARLNMLMEAVGLSAENPTSQAAQRARGF